MILILDKDESSAAYEKQVGIGYCARDYYSICMDVIGPNETSSDKKTLQ